MTQEKLEKHEFTYYNENRIATHEDLKILGLELESKMLITKLELENRIGSMAIKLGTLIIVFSWILFGLLSYFHKG